MSLLILFLCFAAYTTASPWDNLTTTIAVVEFDRTQNKTLTSEEKVKENINKYQEIMIAEFKEEKGLDLIIFPEASLGVNLETSTEIRLNENPCTSSGELLYPQYIIDIACLAQFYETYLVTNIVEKVKCENPNSIENENCKKYGNYFYNTDLVFSRNGTIISRYRKYNLFGEEPLDRPEQPEPVTLDTDFGIKFGIFTCFDILFQNPAQDLMGLNVDGIIYPTNWHSELPFLTALQSQQMFAYSYETVVFAAGGNFPLEASGGSAVYRGSKNTVFSTIVPTGGHQTLVYVSEKGTVNTPEPQDVDDLGKQMDAFPLMTDDSLKDFEWMVLDTNQNATEEQLCSGNDTEVQFCCNFTIKLTSDSPMSGNFYSYLMVAYQGVRHYPNISDGGLEICGLIACLTPDISSCGRRFPKYEDILWPVKFDEITIKANYEINENKTQFPNSLDSSIRPIDASKTNWTKKEVEVDGRKMIERTFAINEPQNRLLTFAIYGRNFAQDWFPRDGNDTDTDGDDGNNAANSIQSMILLSICLLLMTSVAK